MTLIMEKTNMIEKISKDLSINIKQIKSVISLLEEGNTVPFIARYRKEQTGALDEVQIRAVMDSWNYVQNLQTRKEEVLRLIEEQGKLTEELQKDIEKAAKLQTVEDLYRPYKQKRRTKATVAKEKGLEPLAEWMLSFLAAGSMQEEAEKYISVENEVNSAEEAIEGAKDIIAEIVSDDAKYREWIRNDTFKNATLITSIKKDAEDEKNVFEMYYDYSEPVSKIVPHRVLAVNRGEKEGILKASIEPNVERIHNFLMKNVIKKESVASRAIEEAIEDSYKRLIQPSIEREIRNALTETAEDRAIHIFTENLRKLLLQPPLKGKMVLGVDPEIGRASCRERVSTSV